MIIVIIAALCGTQAGQQHFAGKTVQLLVKHFTQRGQGQT